MILKMHCDYCGGSWEAYSRDDWKDDNARVCPHCFSEVDAQTWRDYVIPAFTLAADANLQLVKDHTGQHIPLFTFDLIDNTFFKNHV